MTGFFVTQLLGHYVRLLCAAAREQVDESKRADAAGGQVSDEAMLLGNVALAASFTAFYTRRYETRVLSGITAVVASAEKEHLWQQAGQLYDAAARHGAAAVLHLPPVHQLLKVAAWMLKAENLPLGLLDPALDDFARTGKDVCADQLKRLRLKLELPLWQYIRRGDSKGLRQTYALDGPTAECSGVLNGWMSDEKVLNAPHPLSRPLLLCLDELLPEAQRTTAYQLLAAPYAATAKLRVDPVVSPVRVVRSAAPLVWDKQPFNHEHRWAGCGVLTGGLSLFVGLVSLGSLFAPDQTEGVGEVVGWMLMAVFFGGVGWLLIRWSYPRWRTVSANAHVRRQKLWEAMKQAFQEKKRFAQETRHLAHEAEQQADAPREQLATLVSASYEPCWGGERYVMGRAGARTMWSLETWMGDDLAVRFKAALLPPAHLPPPPQNPPALPTAPRPST